MISYQHVEFQAPPDYILSSYHNHILKHLTGHIQQQVFVLFGNDFRVMDEYVAKLQHQQFDMCLNRLRFV